jgi:transposase
MEIINPNAAGIDVGADSVYVAVPKRTGVQEVKCFGVYTDELRELGRWLKACGVDTVAIESTGVFWVPIYGELVDQGLNVCLVNARHVKNVPGRKSDVQDCMWLRDLHSVGMLRASFIPEEQTRIMREYLRQRQMLIEMRASHINRMQKAMVQMNVRLDDVLSDVTGVTGMAIMRAIAKGEQDPQRLLEFRNRRCKATPEQFVKALTAQYRKEHVFALNQALDSYDVYTRQIAACDEQVKALFDAHAKDGDLPPLEPSTKTNTHSKNRPDYDLRTALYNRTGVDLTEVDGLSESSVQIIISEIGTDMSRWPTVSHFCAWLGLCPKNAITGQRVRSSHIKPGNRRVSQVLRIASQSLLKSKQGLGSYMRRMQSKKGSPFAIVAGAHKLARIVYTMLKTKKPYKHISAADYDADNHARLRKNLARRAAKIGFELTPIAKGATPAT